MKSSILLIVFILDGLLLTKAQTGDQQSEQTQAIPYEKVYLHLDRTLYAAGDDIWFKAYLTDAITSIPANNSNNLYVELISPVSGIVDTRLIRLDNGLGNGDFHLKDSIPAGKYQIRAYTNYMRNFGELFFFTKVIDVVSPLRFKTSTATKLADPSNIPDVQFFPEGGSLIEGVPSVVGVKALNHSGLGINVTGKVITSQGDTVAIFSTSKFGMGSFSFTSNRKFQYFAEGKTQDGVTFRVEMPAPLKEGYALKVSDYSEKAIQITVKTNPQPLEHNPSQELMIVGKSHHAIRLSSTIKVNSVVTSALLPKSELPEGIASITIMDTSGKVYGERLFNISKKSNIRVSVAAGKKTYSPKEKIELEISVKDSLNNPMASNLSLAAVNLSKIQGLERTSNICSYYLLESEIKGYIEQPFYYFDTINTNRFKALDNLLLTQGWRNYVWKEVDSSSYTFNYPFENGFHVSGSLKRTFSNKPLKDVSISMALLDSIHPVFQFCKTDSGGKFYFGQLNFSGEKRLILSANDNENNGKGLISTDSIYRTPPPATFNWKNDSNTVFAGFRQEVEIQREILKKYKLKDTVMLNTVVVKAWKPKPAIDDGHVRIYSEPDRSFTITPQMWGYNNVFEYLEGRVFWPYTGSAHAGGSQLCLLEGIEVDPSVLKTIPMSQIYKVEILKNGSRTAMFGSKGGNGVINVLLKNGSEEKDLLAPVLSSINRSFKGYYQARTFYAPKYDVPSTELKPDLRTTIHWEPNLQTESKGSAICTFYNGEEPAMVKVTVEGITEGGLPIATSAEYRVE